MTLSPDVVHVLQILAGGIVGGIVVGLAVLWKARRDLRRGGW